MRDLLADVVRSLRRRPVRSLLTLIAVALGVGSFVGTVSVSSSGATAVARSFDHLQASEATFQVEQVATPAATGRTLEARLVDYPDVIASGSMVENLTGASLPIARSPLDDPITSITVDAVDPGYLDAVQASVLPGRGPFDASSAIGRGNEALIGQAALLQLGGSAPLPGTTLYVGGVPLRIGGVIRRADRDPRLLSSVIVPLSVAEQLWPSGPVTLQGFVRTRVGMSARVADLARSSVLPERPGAVLTGSSLDVDELRSQVVTQVDSLAVGLGGISLLVGGIGILNSLLVAVFERTPELGLRRCLGGTRSDVAWLVGSEALALSLLGALVGIAVGGGGAALVSQLRGWPIVLPPWVLAAGVGAGAVTGVVGGLYPAWLSSRVSPMAAARS